MTPRFTVLFALACVPMGFVASAWGQDEDMDLAQQLANPVAALISVPVQFNYDRKFGRDDEGSVVRTNIQPVIPLELNDEWNLITRTVLPVVDQSDVPFPGNSEFGLGDTVQSVFFSPKAPTDSGWIWGAGPVFLLPTATDNTLGADQWGLGPTVVALRQNGPWTVGGLANHIESVAGSDRVGDISATFVQPFLTYITPDQTTFGFNTETTYDWEAKEWSVPVNFTVNQLMKFGNQIFQVGGGVRYWVDAPATGPEGWGLRLQFTMLFPR